MQVLKIVTRFSKRAKKVCLAIILLFLFSKSLVAQALLQDKCYIYKGKYILPSVDDKIVFVTYDSVDLRFNFKDYPTHLLPVSVSKRINKKVKYCLLGSKVFSVSINDMRHQIGIAPVFVAINIDSFINKNVPEVKTYLLTYKKTYHGTKDVLILERETLKEAFLSNLSGETSIDFESKGTDNVYMAIKNKNQNMFLYSISLEELPYLTNPKFHDLNTQPQFKLIFSDSTYTGSECNMAYVKNKLFILDEHQNVFRVDEKGLTLIFQNKENAPKSETDSIILVDKDNDELYLGSKESMRNYIGTMSEFLKTCVKVPIR